MLSQLVYKQGKMGMRNILFELGGHHLIILMTLSKSQPTKQKNLTEVIKREKYIQKFFRKPRRYDSVFSYLVQFLISDFIEFLDRWWN